MAYKFLIATMPVPGHVAPFAPLVRELLRRGHEVIWYGSRHFRKGIEATGARFIPMREAIDYGDGQYNKYFPRRAQLTGLKQVVFDFEHLFVNVIPAMHEDIVRILDTYQADVLLGDPAVGATRILGETRGFPAAILNITVVGYESRDMGAFGLGLPFSRSWFGRMRNWLSYRLIDHVVFRSVNRAYARLAKQHGWPRRPFRPSVSDYLHLQPMVPSFEYPLSDIPPTLHFIGVLLPDPPKNFQLPNWWDRVLASRKPIVLVTQGTIATNADELIQPTLEALAREDVWVIAATGGKTADKLGFPVPSNAIVESFIPFTTIMPHVRVYVTNGGYGGICIALAHGVPVIAAGTTEDKTEVGTRVAHSGVGLNLKTNRPSPARVHRAVRALLDDPSFAERARRIRDDLARHDAAAEASNLLEQLARTRKPVERSRV